MTNRIVARHQIVAESLTYCQRQQQNFRDAERISRIHAANEQFREWAAPVFAFVCGVLLAWLVIS